MDRPRLKRDKQVSHEREGGTSAWWNKTCVAGCPMATMVLWNVMKRALKEQVPKLRAVIAM
jgi:Fe-S cluster biogenesis protein NfuA